MSKIDENIDMSFIVSSYLFYSKNFCVTTVNHLLRIRLTKVGFTTPLVNNKFSVLKYSNSAIPIDDVPNNIFFWRKNDLMGHKN